MTRAGAPRPLVLVILDGFGEREERADNAVRLARTPNLSALFAKYPHGLIGTSGPDVGLPPGQMGNSEVGHLNFGAGRIARMDISRIDNAVHDGTLAKNAVIAEVVGKAKAAGGRLHLCGLVSDGGVHSMLAQLEALVDVAKAAGVPVVVHAFLDGRDVQPGTAPRYVSELERVLAGGSGAAAGRAGVIGTASGRYWAMDRDNRWERVERAYRAIAEAAAPQAKSALEGIEKSYAAGKTDEFVEPFVVAGYDGVRPGDAALHFNFRPDRARELTRALALPSFDAFARRDGRAPLEGRYACMTTYDASFGLPIAFPKESFANVFPEVLARAGRRQFRCAETEKYAHVTYFFNGGREEPFEGEDRKMLPSPKDVATYDLRPEMSAAAVADAVVEAIGRGTYDFVLVNFANPDMVGHTGVLDAAVHAVEAVDAGVGRIVEAARARGGAVMITADHGNCELMKDPATGRPHTAHTLNPVPFLYVNDADTQARVRAGGRICDVAPTMLGLLDLPVPAEMTGVPLLERASIGLERTVADLPTIEGYEVLEELGSGALSSVYKAVELPLGRTVAIKVLKSTIATTSPFASQLEREAKVLAELCHPNIGMLLAYVKTESRLMLVLEYVEGPTLSALQRKTPAMSPDAVAAIGAAVARGLAHAHERGVVHRDIKPANILVSLRGEVKIFDFGIAQRASAAGEPVGLAPMRLDDVAAFGTPAYMSPEQILGENVDPRSDVFSLGVVLYQLVCGARPFERGDEAEGRPTAHRIRRDPPIPLHRRAPDVPAALERVIMRAIEKLPADRLQTAEALAEQLEELVEARSGLKGEALVVKALVDAGVVAAPEAGKAAVPTESRRASVRRAVAGLGVIGALVLAGGITIQATAHREGTAAGSRPLELVPASPGYLRVLATPWAEVWVDGQRVDVTPFARGIPLPPGRHYVTFVHPSAPVEKRTVDIEPGESRTIDIVMAVPDLAPHDTPAPQVDAERGKP